MGKKSRKTKAKHQDFQKVKLKVGRKLAKADNETRASFKTRAVLIKNQLKQQSSEPTTKRKLDIKDLLTQLRHYNVTVRHDSLTGLKELLSDNPELVQQHLPALVEQLSELFIDKDGTVRKAALKVLKVIFLLVKEDRISPLFPVLNAYLCSAMTHIQENVKQDSLNILDLLLDYYPALVTKGSEQLLTNFVDQISEKGQGQHKGQDAKRILKVNPGGSLHTSKWRAQILGRLQKLLRAMFTSGRFQGERSCGSSMCVKVTAGHMTHVQPLTSLSPCHNKKAALAFRLVHGLVGSHSTKTGLSLSSSDSLQGFITTIIPLLMQVWVEEGPSQMAAKLPGNCLPAEHISTLQSILHVLQLLQQSVQRHEDGSLMEWFREQYYSELLHYLAPHFPFSTEGVVQGHKGKNKQRKPADIQSDLLGLNISICDILTFFLTSVTRHDLNSQWLSSVLVHLSDWLNQQIVPHDWLTSVLAITKRLLAIPELLGGVNDLIEAWISIFHARISQRGGKTRDISLPLELLEAVILDNKYTHIASHASIQRWLHSLPEALTRLLQDQEQSLQVLQLIRRAAACSLPQLLQAIQNSYTQLLGSLDPGSSRPYCRALIELLHYIPSINRKTLQQLAIKTLHGALSVEDIQYALDILANRCTTHTCSTGEELRDRLNPAHFISLLLTLALGTTQEQISQMSAPGTEQMSCDETECDEDSLITPAHIQICQISCQQLQRLQEEKEVSSVCSKFLSKLLSEHKEVPVRLAWGCVCLADRLLSDVLDSSHQLLSLVAPLCVRLLKLWQQIKEARKSTGRMEQTETWHVVVEDVIALLRKSTGLVKTVVSVVNDDISSCQGQVGLEGTQSAISVLSLLLQNGQLQLQGHAGQFRDTVSLVQNLHPDIQASWWSEFKYTVGLLSGR